MSESDRSCQFPSNVGNALECLGLSWKGFFDDVGNNTSVWDALRIHHRSVYMTVDIALVVIVLTLIQILTRFLGPAGSK